MIRRAISFLGRLFAFMALLTAVFGSHAVAAAGDQYALLDETIRTTFEPVSVTALVYDGSRLKQYPADFVPVPTGVAGEKWYRVATVLPYFSGDEPGAKRKNLSLSFFLVSVDGDFAATVMEEWSAERIEANTRRAADLEKELQTSKQELPKQQARNDALEQELERAKDRASNVTEVEDIIGLKAALEQLKDSDNSGEVELTRLKELVKSGRTREVPDFVLPLRQELSKQLQEVAISTAGTEHLRSSRKQNASTSYFHKLELARQAEGVDLRGLANQVLELRQKRKELEARLGTTAAELAGQAESGAAEPTDTAPGGEF